MVSAIDVTAKRFFERLYLVVGLHEVAPGSTVPMHPQPRPFKRQLFLDFRTIFFIRPNGRTLIYSDRAILSNT